MLAPCLKCHVTDGARIAPVGPKVFQRSFVIHKPHLGRADCAACDFYHPPSLARLVGAM